MLRLPTGKCTTPGAYPERAHEGVLAVLPGSVDEEGHVTEDDQRVHDIRRDRVGAIIRIVHVPPPLHELRPAPTPRIAA